MGNLWGCSAQSLCSFESLVLYGIFHLSSFLYAFQLFSFALVKGCETQGHLILSAAKTEILSQIHMPVWKDQTLMSKTSWSGSLESMQYFATVIPEDSTDTVREETILWLTRDKIEDNKIIADDDLPGLVGSGQSVGGVVSEVVGPAPAGTQLQRIVSRSAAFDEPF